ncbi:hypothetical protein Cadr_000026461 [Camelus dromedarius]|uniref:Uncharacterized protein n=1 Tax=Camelus dromedarius TaxID=9838 RepID=A0A5N4CFA1_CAMDR|nr:hypothetical protein Cadr_000026461 [Camelus dromedarius]
MFPAQSCLPPRLRLLRYQPFFDCAVTLGRHVPSHPGERTEGKFSKTLKEPSSSCHPGVTQRGQASPPPGSRHPRKGQTQQAGERTGSVLRQWIPLRPP